MNFTWKPLIPATWDDFETLFGANGACAGCWCMWWRIPNKEFTANKNAGNHAAMRKLVENGVEPGLLGYVDGKVAGWVSVGSRSDFIRLNTSKVLAPVDDQPVWEIVCFFTVRTQRRQGLMSLLAQAAIEYVKNHGARIVEAFPYEGTPEKKFTILSNYTGVASVFKRLGFKEVARRSESRPIMRLNL